MSSYGCPSHGGVWNASGCPGWVAGAGVHGYGVPPGAWGVGAFPSAPTGGMSAPPNFAPPMFQAPATGHPPPPAWPGHGPAPPAGQGAQGNDGPHEHLVKVFQQLNGTNIRNAASVLAASISRREFLAFVAAGLELVNPDEFKAVWADMPKPLRSVVYLPPPGSIVDVKTLPEAQRPAMYAKLNELRRERCMPLSDPTQQQQQWANEAWSLVPMSKITKDHFWEIFRVLPITSADPSKWASALKFLKDCPEKIDPKAQLDRHLDWNAMHGAPLTAAGTGAGKGGQRLPASPPRRRQSSPGGSRGRYPPAEVGRSRSPRGSSVADARGRHECTGAGKGWQEQQASPPRRCHPSPAGSRGRYPPAEDGRSRSPRGSWEADARGRQEWSVPDHHGRSDARAQLKAYALASPKKASYRSGDDAAWILERVKVDTASLTADSFEVDAERKFPGRSKIAPAQALRQLGGLSACSSDYVDVFKTYQRKLNSWSVVCVLIPPLGKN